MVSEKETIQKEDKFHNLPDNCSRFKHKLTSF